MKREVCHDLTTQAVNEKDVNGYSRISGRDIARKMDKIRGNVQVMHIRSFEERNQEIWQ